MGKYQKLFDALMSAKQDANTKFSDLIHLLEKLGAEKRIKGDHFIIFFQGYEEIINLQPDGNQAKPYQVKQVRQFLAKHEIELEDEDV